MYRFETASPKVDEYVRFIVDTLKVTSARPTRTLTFRFKPSGGLFDRLPFAGRRSD